MPSDTDHPGWAMNRPTAHSPQAIALGIEFLHAEPEVLLKVPYRLDLVGEPATGVIAGGVVTTLLDMACGWAVAWALTTPTTLATLDLRIDYMRPSTPKADLFGTARCYRITKSVAFVRGLAFNTTPDDPVAAVQAAFMLDSNAGRKAGANLAAVQGRPS